ncbi:MAG: rod shape-determining protein RodA [Thermotoga sp.]|nr:MAG: rod shape-determining protein RodA [Thermotoga sp.]
MLVILALLVIGLFAVYSADYGKSSNLTFQKQIVWVFTSAILLILISLIDYPILRDYKWIFYATSIVLLTLSLIIGTKIGGAKRWLKIGVLSFQPSEFAKLFLIIFLSAFLEERSSMISTYRTWILSFITFLIPAIEIALEPDLGTAVILLMIWFLMMFVAGVSYKSIIIFLIIVILSIPLFYNFVLRDYQRARIEAFINPYSDMSGKGYHIIQSIKTLGSGGLWGRGYLKGPQNLKNILPEEDNDFIFAVIGEELGFVGSIGIILLYFILVIRCFRVILHATDVFGTLLASGITISLVLQVFENIGMVAGILPITGLTLPFISAGGSSSTAFALGVGLVLSIGKKGSRLGTVEKRAIGGKYLEDKSIKK